MFPQVPFRILIPNMITLLAICSGLTAVRLSIEGKFDLAVAAVVIAAILDAIDGRVARMLKGTSKFGAELDSLCDFVNFGCVPALMLYFLSFKELGNVGWIAVLLFAIASALRLARFNVMLDVPDKPAFTKDFFTGITGARGSLMRHAADLSAFDGHAAIPGPADPGINLCLGYRGNDGRAVYRPGRRRISGRGSLAKWCSRSLSSLSCSSSRSRASLSSC